MGRIEEGKVRILFHPATACEREAFLGVGIWWGGREKSVVGKVEWESFVPCGLVFHFSVAGGGGRREGERTLRVVILFLILYLFLSRSFLVGGEGVGGCLLRI